VAVCVRLASMIDDLGEEIDTCLIPLWHVMNFVRKTDSIWVGSDFTLGSAIDGNTTKNRRLNRMKRLLLNNLSEYLQRCLGLESGHFMSSSINPCEREVVNILDCRNHVSADGHVA